jgi:S-adenosylmethionine:tRNA ribosyltransferase-isomerase
MITDKIRMEEYEYLLPEERISKFPLQERDASKLLLFTSNNGFTPTAEKFSEIDRFLPNESLIIFNNTRVIPARLLFRRPSGAMIEIFCLEPVEPADYQLNFACTGKCRWKVIVGIIKRWKEGPVVLINSSEDPEIERLDLQAELVERESNRIVVEFSWKSGDSFSKVLEMCGKMPIPPYLKRDSQPLDRVRYQTCYAHIEGSVAAPTAGLHFTDAVLAKISEKGVKQGYISLHVGAGTFLPVKSEYISEHNMHSEPFSISLELLKTLREYASKHIIAVGTTSTRCLESLYFLGVQVIEKKAPSFVSQWEPYREEEFNYTLGEALDALIGYMETNSLENLLSRTEIIIVPGYRFRIIDHLITNFHQPKSTLLLLISAFVGQSWREIYNFALNNGFRFLSYGDSSLLEIRK